MACLFLTTEKLNDAALAYASAGVENSKVDAFSGLKHHAWWHTPDQFEFGGPPNYSSRSHISAALGVLNAWNNGELVEQLSYACDAGHPLMIWLHLWPMFDPWLRKTEAFKALVKRMNLP